MRTTLDTIEFSRHEVESWEIPPFQRPLKINAKIVALAETIKDNGGVVPGIITLGRIDKKTYIIDGQHRIQAWRMADIDKGYADVRMLTFASMAEMGKEFVDSNSSFVRFKADDVLRGMEGTTPALQLIRAKCKFVGYDMIRRNENSGPVVSMSTILRVWMGSDNNCPVAETAGARDVATRITHEEATALCRFANVVFSAWGRTADAKRLWGTLNLALCAWFWRRSVIAPPALYTKTKRWTVLKEEEFKVGMMALAADDTYNDWLANRPMTDRNRPPAWNRIKSIVVPRIADQRGVSSKVIMLPSAEWQHG